MLSLLMLIDTEEERSKFEIIYKTYRNLMYYVAKSILENETDAEDAVHDAFVRIIDCMDKISDPNCPKTKYLCVIIVKRISIDLLRHRKVREKNMSSELIDEVYDDPAALRKLENIDEIYDLEEAIRLLPERYREAVLLRYSDEYSFEEISCIMNVSEANARKIVQRACNKLRVLMTEEGNPDV